MLTKKQAIEKLGKYAYHATNNTLLTNRINAIIQFSKYNKDFSIETNNSWSIPPQLSTAIDYLLIGGTTFQYQVWAVSRVAS